MSDFDKLLRAMRDYSVADFKALARKSGVPWQTAYKVARGITARPSHETVAKLARAIL